MCSLNYLLIICVLIIQNTFIESYNILGVFPYPGNSHSVAFKPLLKSLAERGHNLTVISFHPLDKKIPRYNDVVLNGSGLSFTHALDLEMFNNPKLVQFGSVFLIHGLQKEYCQVGLESKTYQDLLNSTKEFDLILSEYFNSNCLLLPIINKWKVPLIGFTSTILMPWTNDWVGNAYNPSYVPLINLDKSDYMTFLERVENTISLIFSLNFYKYVMEPFDLYIAKKYVGDLQNSVENLMSNTSLILTYTQFSLTRPRSLVPNIIEVGGLNLASMERLPKDIEKWITDSPHGVIYFSLGSMIKGHTFPEEKLQMFLNAFSRLPQRVLWKWEVKMPNQPKNVMIKKWMPQFDILNHPNVKAFISHGGLLGTTEAVHCGVPMLVMPQFGDQFANARALEASGGGIMLDFSSITEEVIYNSLRAILEPDFNKKAKELSERFRDRPLPPLDTAIYWVEYVARHKGAPHMRTAAVGMPFYQYLLLDVIAFLAVILFVFFYIFYFVTKTIFRKLFKSKPLPDKVKKQ